MNKFHLHYENLEKLRQFISNKKLKDSEGVIVKIYMTFNLSNDLEKIKNLFYELVPNAKVLAIFNDDNFSCEDLDDKDKIVISISSFAHDEEEKIMYDKKLMEVNISSEFTYHKGLDRRIIDELVGVYNRYKLTIDIKESKLNKIALFDLSGFKKINNFYGNKIGDKLLVKIAAFLKEETENQGVRVYRTDGDVFAVMGHVSLSNEKFVSLVRSLQNTLNSNGFKVDEEEIFLSVVLAIAYDVDSLLEKADLALEYAKRESEEYFIFDKKLDLVSETNNNLLWTDILRRAIAEDRVVPYYQGIFNNKTNSIEKYESLMRVIDEDGNAITPYHFLEIARQSGLYKTMMKMIINKTFDKFKDNDYSFSINLWRRDMLDGEIKDLILKRLDEKTYNGRVIFEILETDNIQNYETLTDFIMKVKEKGAKIAIDDFGTGYANYDHLIKIKPDIIKIDGSIIKNIGVDKQSLVATESILYFAKKFGCLTVAEFVSDEDIYVNVKDLNIEFSQGYYFAIPIADPFEK